MIKRFISAFVVLLAFTNCTNDLSETVQDGENTMHRHTKTVAVSSQLVVGYFPSWSETFPSASGTKLRNLPEEVTHVFLSFVKPDMRYEKGSFDLRNTGLEVPYDGQTLKESVDILKAKGINVIISIGGETYWGTDAAYNIDYQQIADFVRDFGFQGIDWDYEPNGGFATIGTPQNVQRFITMIRSSRALLPKEEGFLIACAPAGCGALGRPTPYPNDDPDSPYAYAKRAEVTGDDLANEYNSIDPNGYTISLYGFESTGHMIPVFKAVGEMLDFVAFQGYNTGSASKREIMYDSYAYYANIYGFKVAFGMHVPEEPWGPYYTYTADKVREYATYIADGGKHNRAGKGDGVMFWQLLQQSKIEPSHTGITYSVLAHDILENKNPVTTPSIYITSPANNAFIKETIPFTIETKVRKAETVLFYIDEQLVATLHNAPYQYTVLSLALGMHTLKVKGINAKGEFAEASAVVKIIDEDSLEGLPLWKADVAYEVSGTEVVYEEKVWRNKWWTQGDVPGIADVWEYVRGGDNSGSSVIAEYDANKTYAEAGTVVLYNGKKYRNKWWTKGDIPGEDPNGPWEEIK